MACPVFDDRAQARQRRPVRELIHERLGGREIALREGEFGLIRQDAGGRKALRRHLPGARPADWDDAAALVALGGEAAHVQALENRAHAEVDRARQEVKELQGRLTAVTKNQAASEASLRQALDEARTATAEASRSASSERARADALEKQLSKLQDLPAALEAAMRRRQLPLKPRKSVSKRANRGAEKQP